ncbi:CPBP family intramembrane glutamic endopeptidase [Dictyobacter kobayashii]|uniref:CPBP family intramembrane glutamic endopeptidase n=1 Tax=Dictyobacter kobayashii TaxID=2014872 RepID=UPI00138718C1|nr:CPBP family intramembrane glutamic endopeptidase [Dictyobacter kobayashii]
MITGLVLCDSLIFGLPNFGSLSFIWILAAIGSGLGYYIVERIRLARPEQGVIRIMRQVEQQAIQRVIVGMQLVWIALIEEILFRWYLLMTPLQHTPVLAIATLLYSSLAFGLIHQQFGSSTMVSRMIFGLVLGIFMLATGNLLIIIVAHVTYNALVYAWPVSYSTIRYTA